MDTRTAKEYGRLVARRKRHSHSRIRVLLVELPPMLRDIVCHAISGQHDMETVGELDRSAPVTAVVEQQRVDVVIVGAEEGELPPSCAEAIRRRPSLRVVTITPSGGDCSVYELFPRRTPVGDLSHADLLATVRGALP